MVGGLLLLLLITMHLITNDLAVQASQVVAFLEALDVVGGVLVVVRVLIDVWVVDVDVGVVVVNHDDAATVGDVVHVLGVLWLLLLLGLVRLLLGLHVVEVVLVQ